VKPVVKIQIVQYRVTSWAGFGPGTNFDWFGANPKWGAHE